MMFFILDSDIPTFRMSAIMGFLKHKLIQHSRSQQQTLRLREANLRKCMDMTRVSTFCVLLFHVYDEQNVVET